jgi:hypothetical protein
MLVVLHHSSRITDLDIVAELLQASTAVNVLTCVTTQPAVVAGASLNEILVTAPQPSVADALPSAAVIAVASWITTKRYRRI